MATTISQSSHPSKRETKLARSLVHPEKHVRDTTFTALVDFTRGVKNLSDLEMLKLWKALYYCMWLADKREVQEELADSFANMIGEFRNNHLRLQFIQMYFRILLREWSLLDLHRMNKFYYLTRVIIRKALETSYEQLSKSEFAEALNNVLFSEALTQRPNGIRFHLADLFLSEMRRASKGKCDTKFFLLSIEPFLRLLTEGDDNVVMDRVSKSIFQAFAESHAREIQDDSNKEMIFSNVDTRLIQAKLFEIASNENTGGRYRSRLYNIHKLFANTTGLEFVDEQSLSLATGNDIQKADKKDKKKKRGAEVLANCDQETPAAETLKKKKKSA
jgi:ribosomal RNA-processing protein 1